MGSPQTRTAQTVDIDKNLCFHAVIRGSVSHKDRFLFFHSYFTKIEPDSQAKKTGKILF